MNKTQLANLAGQMHEIEDMCLYLAEQFQHFQIGQNAELCPDQHNQVAQHMRKAGWAVADALRVLHEEARTIQALERDGAVTWARSNETVFRAIRRWLDDRQADYKIDTKGYEHHLLTMASEALGRLDDAIQSSVEKHNRRAEAERVDRFREAQIKREAHKAEITRRNIESRHEVVPAA